MIKDIENASTPELVGSLIGVALVRGFFLCGLVRAAKRDRLAMTIAWATMILADSNRDNPEYRARVQKIAQELSTRNSSRK